MLFSLFTFLIFGPLVAFAYFDSIYFSPVQQCGNFTISFSGGKPPASLPLVLTVVPFHATPLSIDIPNSDWNSTTVTGAAITFLPFPAGTDFVASLDDANGVGTAQVSDVIRVTPSDDTSCLGQDASKMRPRYTVDNALSQCKSFDVRYDADSVDAPPSIRAFVPKNISTLVDQTNPGRASLGQTSYTMDILGGQQVVLMFSDDTGFRETSDLLVVQGSSESSTDCLPNFTTLMVTPTQTSAPDSAKSSLSGKAAIIIGIVSGCIIGAIAITMGCWLQRERRRVAPKSLKMLEESSYTIPKGRRWRRWRRGTDRAAQSSKKSGMSGRILRDPPYTDVKFELVTPTFTRRPVDPVVALPDTTGDEPLSSIPVPLTTPLPPILGEGPIGSSSADRQIDNVQDTATTAVEQEPSLSPADIETILDTARLYSSSERSLGAEDASEATGDRVSKLSVVTIAVPAAAAAPQLPTPILLTPHSAMTYRDPPQAPLPSSALPSPAGNSFRIASILSFDSGRESIMRKLRRLSGFSFFRTERSSVADSFLAM